MDTSNEDKSVSLFKEAVGTLTKLGGGIAIFYALGFIVLQCFVSSAGLEGMFWFSREYYEEAGAKFIVDMVQAPLMKPQYFLVYLAMLLLLIPKHKTDDGDSSHGIESGFRELASLQNKKMYALGFIILATYLFAVYFKPIASNVLYDLPGMDVAPTKLKFSLIFFSFTMPVAIASTVYLLRFRKYKECNRSLYNAIVTLYIVFIAILPISYGRDVYDMMAIPINDPDPIFTNAGIKQDIPEKTKVWLIGQFGGKYHFLLKDYLNDKDKVSFAGAKGVIEALDEEKVKNINFKLEKAVYLKELMESNGDDVFITEASSMLESLYK